MYSILLLVVLAFCCFYIFFRHNTIRLLTHQEKKQGRITDADIWGGERRSQLGAQGRGLQVRSPPEGFSGMPPMKFMKCNEQNCNFISLNCFRPVTHPIIGLLI